MGSNQNKARVLNLNTFSKKKGKSKLYQLKNVVNTQVKGKKEGGRKKNKRCNLMYLYFIWGKIYRNCYLSLGSERKENIIL